MSHVGGRADCAQRRQVELAAVFELVIAFDQGGDRLEIDRGVDADFAEIRLRDPIGLGKIDFLCLQDRLDLRGPEPVFAVLLGSGDCESFDGHRSLRQLLQDIAAILLGVGPFRRARSAMVTAMMVQLRRTEEG